MEASSPREWHGSGVPRRAAPSSPPSPACYPIRRSASGTGYPVSCRSGAGPGGPTMIRDEQLADQATGARRLRADAARNREAVLCAAREVFAEAGLDAPLEEIAR